MGNYMYHSHSHSHSPSYIFIRKNYQWDVTFTRLFFLTRNRKKKKIPWWNWVFHLSHVKFIRWLLEYLLYIYIYTHTHILLCLKISSGEWIQIHWAYFDGIKIIKGKWKEKKKKGKKVQWALRRKVIIPTKRWKKCSMKLGKK